MKRMVSVESVDSYLAAQPEHVRLLLEEIRRTIREVAPDAKEVISYMMPAFKLNTIFVFYAGFKNHYSLFVPKVLDDFRDELTQYKTSKATINIPFDKPIPSKLVKKLVKAAIKIDLERARPKRKA